MFIYLKSNRQYRQIIEALRKKAYAIELVDVCCLDDEVIKTANKLMPLIETSFVNEWNGTVTGGSPNKRYLFKSNDKFFEYLLNFESFFLFRANLKDNCCDIEFTDFGINDISFYDKDNTLLFYTTTHEGYAHMDEDFAEENNIMCNDIGTDYINYDVNSEYYNNQKECDCPICRNFYMQADYCSPFSDSLCRYYGIEFGKPDRIISKVNGNKVAYTLYYSISGTMTPENEIDEECYGSYFKTGDFGICTEMQEPKFMLKIHNLKLPFILEYELNDSTSCLFEAQSEK